MQLHIVRGHAVTLTDGLHMHAQAEMVHRHAFGLAGGTGGVDQVGQIERMQLHCRSRSLESSEIQLIQIQRPDALT